MSRGKSTRTQAGEEMHEDESVIRIPPYHFIHILDQNTNIARVESGPKTYIRQDHERIIFRPEKMVVVPPRHYCVIMNPVVRDDQGTPVLDEGGQVKLNHGDLEIRLVQKPFHLFPGEIIEKNVRPLKIIYANTALRLRAMLDFEDESESRVAGDEWLFQGPGTYIPKKEVEEVETISAIIIYPNQALKLKARKETKDRDGNDRVAGEEWLWKKVGAYLLGAYEEVVGVVDAYILTEKKALHMLAKRTFRDENGQLRRNGEEWLITMNDAESHIPDVSEEVQGVVDVTTLSLQQYCVLVNPVGADGKPQLGQRKLVKGEKSFFLQPGEQLENGIQEAFVLEEEMGLVLRAKQNFVDENTDEDQVNRKAGDRWMIRGPVDYIPPVEVEVIAERTSIPMDDNEGVYVRNIKTGKVRVVCGETYMLTQVEELWEKQLPPLLAFLLCNNKDPRSDRGDYSYPVDQAPQSRTRGVTYRVPHNAASQIYDYTEKKARVVFGPDLVMLGPDEQFTVLSLSGGKPKKPNVIRSICLLLGPDFCGDIITVETADHARLQLQISFNWHFDISDKAAPEEASRLFSVPDFVGDFCKAIASRIRGSVASVQFDDFHKNSAKIIRTSVFGLDHNLKVMESFRFSQNNLVITSVDIQSVEPVDQRTRDSLQKSVQLAIEITTKSQEATAKHEAERLEQEARGRLERQKILDQAESEKARKELLELQALSVAVESTGEARAEAQSRAEAAKIEGETAVAKAKLQAEASMIEAESELERLCQAREAELKYIKEKNGLELVQAREMATIEIRRFCETVQSLGAETIKAMASAGPDTQLKMLKALGLQSTLITDGSSPVNLLTTAAGLVGGLPVFPRKSSGAEEHE
uniref:major vault protein-like n=1 Tax=Myxine glutinosa TaxID=7769 RepID=UPI00358F7B16